ncbi:LOW QUALITY PROTEIN: RxLR effector protein [Phytophthora megakarya]|uniref:RxLR effector protein n=1 Tax=Phytophthora megakarya TaxID=4795 RepID=A0A225WAF5_9STRA|nr:LOW QUALITY PROTEIN: RxLR effector protein [Phytophthora megakarya]
MTAKFTSLTCCRLYLFLVIVAYQPCTGKPSSIDVPISSNLHHDTTAELKDVQHKRYLRVRLSTTMNQNVSSDERGLGKSSVMTVKDLTITTAEKIKSIIANARLKMSSKTQQATDLSFTTLNVNKVETNILESAEFQMWLKSVNKAYKNNVKEGEVAMVTTLTFYYGDEALIKLLNDAKSVSTTNVIAQKLEEAQFTRWLTDEKTMDYVFKLLKLDQVGESLFKSPLMPTWVRNANKFQTKPDEAMFLTLNRQFNDNALAKMIIAHGSIAARLENVELEQWLSSGKTSDDIFRFLDLNDDNSNLLQNQSFTTWISFVIKAEKENPYGYVFAKLSNR